MNFAQTDKKWFKETLENKNLIRKIKNIKLIVTDIDGALTDGQLDISTIHNSNTFYKNIGKNFSVQDGFAIVHAIKNKHFILSFLTGRTDKAVEIRAKMLQIPEEHCFTGIDSKKIEKVKILQEKNNITIEETLHFGDDFLDFEVKKQVGIMTCPQNTPFYFQEEADLVIPRPGGISPFRLLLDLILFVQKKHFAQNFIEKTLQK